MLSVVLAAVSTPLDPMVYSLNPPVPKPAATMYFPVLSRAMLATLFGAPYGDPLRGASVPLAFENPEIELAALVFPAFPV